MEIFKEIKCYMENNIILREKKSDLEEHNT